MASRSFCSFRVRQRADPNAVSFFVFAARPQDVVQWSVVDRVEERKGGIQRRLSEARRRAMLRFFTRDTRNIIPTSVVLSFPPGTASFVPTALFDPVIECSNALPAQIEWGTLSFEYTSGEPIALVVDGQHRLFSMADVSNSTEESVPILVSALLDADVNEAAFQFIVINNKVNKVPPDLVRSLIVDFNEEELQTRLETARVTLQPMAILVATVDDDPDSPLKGMIRWERHRNGGTPVIRPVAIEESLRYARRHINGLDEDEDTLIEFFFAMWRGIKRTYPSLWVETDNKLFSNAGFKAFSEYLVNQIDVLAGIDYLDVLVPEKVVEVVQNLASQVDIRFWTATWKYKSLDTSSGRELIKEDIESLRQNAKQKREWFTNLVLVSVGGDNDDEDATEDDIDE